MRLAAAPASGPDAAQTPGVTLAAAPAATAFPTASVEAAAPANSIAVLPFTNLSGADANAWFADGVSEELMYLLTRTPGLRVASRTSAFACRDLKLDARGVAERLNVAWLLEGSVRRAGDMLRIVAQLTDARNGYQVWSESYDRSSSDIFAHPGRDRRRDRDAARLDARRRGASGSAARGGTAGEGSAHL